MAFLSGRGFPDAVLNPREARGVIALAEGCAFYWPGAWTGFRPSAPRLSVAVRLTVMDQHGRRHVSPREVEVDRTAPIKWPRLKRTGKGLFEPVCEASGEGLKTR